jgi:hypothetical protein
MSFHLRWSQEFEHEDQWSRVRRQHPGREHLHIRVWAQAQTGAQPHGHDQTSTAQGMQPPKTVLKQVTDTIAKMPQHEVRVVTATLPAGVTGGWHKHSAPVYVYLSEGVATLELDGGDLAPFRNRGGRRRTGRHRDAHREPQRYRASHVRDVPGQRSPAALLRGRDQVIRESQAPFPMP